MRILLDVKDNKAEFVMELLGNFPFVKAEPLSSAKTKLIKELKASVQEVILAKKGKLKLKSAEQLLNEL